MNHDTTEIQRIITSCYVQLRANNLENLPIKAWNLIDFTAEFYQTFKENYQSYSNKSKKWRRREYFQTHSMPVLP